MVSGEDERVFLTLDLTPFSLDTRSLMLVCGIQATEIWFQKWRAYTNSQKLLCCFLAGGAADVLHKVSQCAEFASLCKVSAILANVPELWHLWRSCSTARRGCGTASPGSEVPFSCDPILAAPRLLHLPSLRQKRQLYKVNLRILWWTC